MTTVSSVISYTQQLAQTDVNGISSILGLAFYNDALQDMTRDLIERGIDAAQVREEQFSVLTVNKKFTWTPSMFALKTIEVDYTGSGGQNFIQAEKVDVSNLQSKTSWDWLRANQPTNSPLFTNHGNTGEIFPTPTGTALVNIWYYLIPVEATTVGDTVIYPQTLDFRMLSAKMAALYYNSQQNPNMATVWENEYQKRLGKIKSILAPQSKQPTTPESLHISGWNF